MTKEELKKTVREAMNEVIGESGKMPVPGPAPVTEIIIRVGTSGAIQMLGGGGGLGCPCPCIESAPKITAGDIKAIDKDAFDVIQAILDEKAGTQEQVIMDALCRAIVEQLRKDEPKKFEELARKRIEKQSKEQKS